MPASLLIIVALGCTEPAAASRVTASGVMELVTRLGAEDALHQLSEESGWTTVLDGIAGGGSGWLRVAASFRPVADGHVAEDLTCATSEALVHNPTGVLNLARQGTFSIERVCGWQGFLTNDENATKRKLHAFIRRQRQAVTRVASSELATTKEACLTQLLRADDEVTKYDIP